MKKVLVLGAGLVTRPLVRYLLDNGFYVTVASRTVSKAEKVQADIRKRFPALESRVGEELFAEQMSDGQRIVSRIIWLFAAHYLERPDACIPIIIAALEGVQGDRLSGINLFVELVVTDLAGEPGIFRDKILPPRKIPHLGNIGQLTPLIFGFQTFPVGAHLPRS